MKYIFETYHHLTYIMRAINIKMLIALLKHDLLDYKSDCFRIFSIEKRVVFHTVCSHHLLSKMKLCKQ